MENIISSLVSNTNFWVLLSTVLCVGLIAWKAGRPILQGLDQRANAIHARLAEAENLRLEAQQILEVYKKKSEEALDEAESVLKHAEKRAEQLRAQLEKEMREAIARQERNARMRITRMQEEAIRQIKEILISTALTDVKEHARDHVIIRPSVEHSLADIQKLLQR